MLLFKAGDQVPLIPLFDVVGKADKGEPAQIGATAEKVGVTIGVIVKSSTSAEAGLVAMLKFLNDTNRPPVLVVESVRLVIGVVEK